MVSSLWFSKFIQKIEENCPERLPEITANRKRIICTIERLKQFDLEGKTVGAIGIGGVGLACALQLNAKVDGYDFFEGSLVKHSKKLCNNFSLPFSYLDLNKPKINLNRTYDVILLCQVIEHLARTPLEVIKELCRFLKPGGLVFITTPNLSRLSNRIRMLKGQRIFSIFVPGRYGGHVREYTPEELKDIFVLAGLSSITWELVCLPGYGRSFLTNHCYKLICRVFPRLSNYIFCYSRNS